jgi:hypothetical protein
VVVVGGMYEPSVYMTGVEGAKRSGAAGVIGRAGATDRVGGR